MSKIYIGIDNGITGAISWILPGGERSLLPVPTKKEQSYTKKKQNITRVDAPVLQGILQLITMDEPVENVIIILERPYVNPKGFKATSSALRCLEAELCVIELLELPYMYIDSRLWQKEFLPARCKGKELKDKSKEIGIRLFPDLSGEITKQKDADALFIAEWARRKGL